MGMWGLTKKEILKGKCPVTDGVPRSSDEARGFTRSLEALEAALATPRASRRLVLLRRRRRRRPGAF